MAKQIKAIKCPQCGSNKHTKISEDHYKCISCGTEYFLDNDDININIKHQAPSNSPNVLKWVAIGLVSFILLSWGFKTCVSSVFRSSSSRNTPTYNTYSTYSTSSKPKDPPRETVKENLEFGNIPFAFESKEHKKVAFSLISKKYSNSDKKTEYYLCFKDLATRKTLEEFKLPIEDCKNKEYKEFTDGKKYVIINKKYIFLIHPEALHIENVSESLFTSQSALSSGIAQLDFTYGNNGLNLLTNMGEEYRYFPIPDKLYTKDQYYDAEKGMKNLLPGAKNVTFYDFSAKSDDFPKEPIQLLKIIYKFNAGGPENIPQAKWFKDYLQYGIIYDNSPFNKRLFNNYLYRVVSYEDLTPGRIYFYPLVMYSDENILIIKFRPTIAEDAPVIMQCLNLKDNMKIEWNHDLDKDYKNIRKLIKTSDGFLGILNSKTVIAFNPDGTLAKKYEL